MQNVQVGQAISFLEKLQKRYSTSTSVIPSK